MNAPLRRALVRALALCATLSSACAHDLRFLDRTQDASAPDASTDAPAPACRAPANGEACDPVANCGCAETQSCAGPDIDVRRSRCVNPGAGGEGAECTRANECSAGLSCPLFTCRRACRARADCRAGEVCVADEPGDVIGSCARVDECEPGSGCARGVHCEVESYSEVGGGALGVAWCEEPDGDAAEGASCDSASCLAPFDCRQFGGSFTCLRRCRSNADCTGAGRATCDLGANAVTVGATRWGDCVAP
jgi:hypothetical protein